MTAVLSELHRRHLSALGDLPAVVDGEGLRIGDQYTMFFAEAELMRRHAMDLLDGVAAPDVLEVGLGLGVFLEQAALLGVRSYTAIEAHPGVADLAQSRLLDGPGDRVTVVRGAWQLVALPDSAFDAVMYDTWPPDGHADSDFATFVEQVAIPCLRPGGRFSFFHSGDRLSPARAAVIHKHFADVSIRDYTMPAELVPAHWTKPTRDFLVPVATKAG